MACPKVQNHDCYIYTGILPSPSLKILMPLTECYNDSRSASSQQITAISWMIMTHSFTLTSEGQAGRQGVKMEVSSPLIMGS